MEPLMNADEPDKPLVDKGLHTSQSTFRIHVIPDPIGNPFMSLRAERGNLKPLSRPTSIAHRKS
jgi:hypothetical protein